MQAYKLISFYNKVMPLQLHISPKVIWARANRNSHRKWWTNLHRSWIHVSAENEEFWAQYIYNPSKGLAISYLWWSEEKNYAKQSKHSLVTALLQIVIKGRNVWQTRDVMLVHKPSNTYICFIIYIFKRLMINLLIS